MLPQNPQPLALERIAATYRKRLEVTIARLPSGPDREDLREEVRKLDAAHDRGRCRE
jgi:hypothetical protein